MRIGTIAAAIAALAVIAYLAPMLDVGTPFNATAQQSVTTVPSPNVLVDWIKVILLLGVGGGVAVQVKRLFGRR